ncbi:hypothetical protein ABZV41_35815 [Streptomyces sp. NPDC005098]|uniref:hypothetical protein n=1 Tax=Streptomyces sp. NPDC005098 TaxID=3154560 RepID=UPI0033B8E3C2
MLQERGGQPHAGRGVGLGQEQVLGVLAQDVQSGATALERRKYSSARGSAHPAISRLRLSRVWERGQLKYPHRAAGRDTSNSRAAARTCL